MQAKPSRSSRITAVRLFTALAAVALAAALLGGVLAPRGDAAATISAQLVKDINPGSAGSTLDNLAVFNGKLYFAASDGTHGPELWKSDGTTAGTVMVKDIYPGANGSNPGNFAVFNGSLYFSANSATASDPSGPGFELWKTDGTDTGTVMVADIYPGTVSSYPSDLTVAGGNLYFQATDNTHGYELWKSDGVVDTDDNNHTKMVKDINVGIGNSAPQYLTAFNGDVYFVATDGGAAVGNELWKSDGTSVGTVPVTNISAGNSDPYNLTPVGSWLYFAADDGTHGTQLYRTDGTPDTVAGHMQPFKVINTGGDANPGGTYSDPEGITVSGGNLYFSATDGSNGIEPWKSDGTSGGTNMLKNINTTTNYGGSTSSFPLFFTAWNGSLYFQATDGPQSPPTHYAELWKSDGTEPGTNLLKDINTSGTMAGSSDPSDFTALNGSLYFQASDGTTGVELWKTDGSAAGTVMVADINPGSGSGSCPGSGSGCPQYLTAVGNNLLFAADDGTHGAELWEAGDYSPPETQIDSGPSGTITSSVASFSFSADEAATFQCAFDGAAMSACTSPKAFNGLADGAHTFQVRATDLVGNVDASPASRSFTVDAAAPETQIDSGPSGTVTTASVTFTFSSNQAGTFQCSLDGGVVSACTSPRLVGPLANGSHTFRVQAIDVSGNIDPSPAERSFTVNVPATPALTQPKHVSYPQTTITKHPKKVVSTASAGFKFKSSKKGSHFSCKLDKGKWASCRSPKAYKVKPGKHTFQVRATSSAGKTDPTPAKWTWTVKRG